MDGGAQVPSERGALGIDAVEGAPAAGEPSAWKAITTVTAMAPIRTIVPMEMSVLAAELAGDIGDERAGGGVLELGHSCVPPRRYGCVRPWCPLAGEA
jgi:hypothetical protein